MQAFFFRRSYPWSRAFLTETVETGDKNRDDFRCMQRSLMVSMWLVFGAAMTEMMHVS